MSQTDVTAPLRDMQERLKAARPDPLVLSLPEVPEGAVALRGGARWLPSASVPGFWEMEGGSTPHALGAVLDAEDDGTNKGVTIEMTPPREPRTWGARLLVEGPPDDLCAVRAGSGTGEIYRRDPDNPDRWVSERGVAERWELLREVDLVEVLDDQS